MSLRPFHGLSCRCGCRPASEGAPTEAMAPRRVLDVHVLEVWFDGSESTTITSSIELDMPGFTSRRFDSLTNTTARR